MVVINIYINNGQCQVPPNIFYIINYFTIWDNAFSLMAIWLHGKNKRYKSVSKWFLSIYFQNLLKINLTMPKIIKGIFF